MVRDNITEVFASQNKSKQKRRVFILQRGRSMVEMLGVLAIVSVLTVGSFSLVSSMYAKQAINNIVDDISEFAVRTHNVVREYDSVADGNLNDYIYAAKAYPESAVYDSATHYFVANEDVQYSFTYGSTGLSMTLKKVSLEACSKIAIMNWGSGHSTGFKSIKVNSTAASEQPLSITGAATACAEGKNNTIILLFN